MTESVSEDPPALKATDDDLLEAVERVAVALDAPAVPTGQVAAELPIKRQTVKRRLDDLAEEGRVASLATGQGRIWWIPDGEGGYVDPAALDRPIEGIDPHDIPPDLAREIAEKRLPEFQPPETIWERLHEWGNGRADDVVTLLGIGTVFLLVPSFDLLSEQLTTVGIGVGLLDFLGIIIIAAAILLAIVAGCSRAVGAIGEQTVERGYIDPNIFSQN